MFCIYSFRNVECILWKILPEMLIKEIGKVCLVLHEPTGVRCDPEVQQCRFGGFRAPPYFCYFSLCPLVSCDLFRNYSYRFTTAATNGRKGLEWKEDVKHKSSVKIKVVFSKVRVLL